MGSAMQQHSLLKAEVSVPEYFVRAPCVDTTRHKESPDFHLGERLWITLLHGVDYVLYFARKRDFDLRNEVFRNIAIGDFNPSQIDNLVRRIECWKTDAFCSRRGRDLDLSARLMNLRKGQ